MNSTVVRRALAAVCTALAVLAAGWVGVPNVLAGIRRTDPAQVVPLAQIAPQYREIVAEVISTATFHQQGAPDTFACNPQMYLMLLEHPDLTLALWQDLSSSQVRLQQVSPDRYQGTDGSGASATWEYAYRSPRLHVLLCHLDYVGPRGNTRLSGRCVLIVRSDYFRKGQSEHWIRHDVELYVKVDSRGWRAVAKTVRPILERVIEDQVQEAGLFVSLMGGRLVEMYPDWACQVAQRSPTLAADLRQNFTNLVLQTRRPGAQTGRPVLADNTTSATRMR